jgi:PTH1 family peptidyl-tRNA hydrolase
VKVIVGLGNPGGAYAGTPHNVGFDVVDRLAAELDGSGRRRFRFQAWVGRAALGGNELLLVKPRTYMNRSGTAVQRVLHYHRLSVSDLVVVVDDADLAFGRLRIRGGGSSGGHRGLGSIIDALGSNAFARVRLGIGRRERDACLAGHVLTPFGAQDRPVARRLVEAAAGAVRCLVSEGLEAAMNRYNGFACGENDTQTREQDKPPGKV